METHSRTCFTPLLFATTLLVALGFSGCAKSRARAHLADADRYFQSGDYAKAEIEYKNALQASPLNPDAIAQLGIIFFDEGRLRLSVPYLLKARELRPENLDVRVKLGLIYRASGKLKEAKEEANFVLDRKPTDESAPILLVDASFATPEEVQVARQRLTGLPGKAADGAPVLVALGLIELRQRNFAAAEAAFNRAIAADPKYPMAYSALGALYRFQKDTPRADQALKTAAKLAPPRSGKLLQYAQFKFQIGDTAAGRRILEDVIKQVPDYLPALSMMAELNYTEKKYDESATLTAKVLAGDPEQPEAMLLNGRLKLAKREFPEAITAFERMLRTYPKSAPALFNLGVALAASGDTTKAIERLNQSIAIAPTPEAVMTLANVNLRKGDYSAVVIGLKPLVQQNPGNASARLTLAEAYRGLGDFDNALALYRASEKSQPNSPNASVMEGMTLVQQKKFSEARIAFGEALKRQPDYLPAIEQLVSLDAAEKKYDAALQRVDTELAKNPKSAPLHMLRAQVFLAQSANDQGEAELQKTIELQPDALNAYFLLTRLYITSNQQQKALASLQAVLAKKPTDQQALLLTGMIQEGQKNYPAAREAYEKVLAVNPKSSIVLNNLAYLYSERFNELDKAYDAAQRARDLLPSEPHVADTLGWILYKKGQYARALALLEESAGNMPADADVQFHLGMTRYMLGQEGPARTALQRALELNKNVAGADEARRRLTVLTTDVGSGGNDATAALEKMRAEQPADPVVIARLAARYEHDGATDKAIAAYHSASEVNPGAFTPLLNLARLYEANKDLPKALDAAKTARKIAPDDAEVARILGELTYQAGDFTRAANLLQEAARKQPDNSDVAFEAARAIYSVGRVEDAAAAIREIISPGSPGSDEPTVLLPTATLANPAGRVGPANEARPTFKHAAEARRFLDMIEITAHPEGSARAHVEEALRQEPDLVPALVALGAIEELTSNSTAARQAYEKALVHYPEFSPAKVRLAILGAAQPQFDQQSYDWAQQARTAFPNDPDLAKALGTLIYRKGDDDSRAVILLKQSAASRSTDPEIMYFLGLTQKRLRQNAAAKTSLQRALELGLKGNAANEARQALSDLK